MDRFNGNIFQIKGVVKMIAVEKCVCCSSKDSTGFINGLCTDCYDLSLDIGKVDTKETKKKKRELENRKLINGH